MQDLPQPGLPALLSPTSAPSNLKVGVLLWPQGATWKQLLDAARRADRAGLDSVWTWDHLRPLVGPTDAPIFEGWTTVAALAASTDRCGVGLMVGAALLRHAELVVKSAITVDHISGGRCVLGLGAGSVATEHDQSGAPIEIGTRDRIAHLERTAARVQELLGRGNLRESPRAENYRDRPQVPVLVAPGPVPGGMGVPILIGGSGRRFTIPVAARYADIWSPGAPTVAIDYVTHRAALLDEACRSIGRDPAEIERTLGPTIVIRDGPDDARDVIEAALRANGVAAWGDESSTWLGSPIEIAERWKAYAAVGFRHLITELLPPFDEETIERIVEVRELVGNA
jgi:alkanesulfonate monooxygenase SsuD/methylene tetrahydromethanopterin reductase-like flavin-dependent oxidoreductase (luciferase family)